MQGLADGTFIAPATVTAWLAGYPTPEISADHPACREALARARARLEGLLAVQGQRPVDAFHRELGDVMIERCGISRTAEGLQAGLQEVEALEQRFLAEVRVPGQASGPNPELEKALRVADFVGLAQLMLRDALAREESCGAHFREEHQTPDGEARRDDDHYAHIAAWEHRGDGLEPLRHAEPLQFTALQPSARSYR
jgi:succinate dehydrogenase / fumarate reductase flavoprotein subunit